MFANVDNDGCIRQCRKSKIAVIVTFMFAFCMFVFACSFLHVHCWIVCELYQSCCLFEGMWDHYDPQRQLQIVDRKMYLRHLSLRRHVRLFIANCWLQNVSVLFVSSRACEIIHRKLLIANFWLQIVDCKLLIANCWLQIVDWSMYLIWGCASLYSYLPL